MTIDVFIHRRRREDVPVRGTHGRDGRSRPFGARSVVAALCSMLIVASLLAGCGRTTPAETHAAALAVGEVLHLRHDLVSDPAAYAPLLQSSAVATELASAAKAATSGASPIPEWKTPYVSATTSKTAEVVVVWQRSGRFAKWAVATVFKLQRRGARWVVVDAQNVTGKPPEPLK